MPSRQINDIVPRTIRIGYPIDERFVNDTRLIQIYQSNTSSIDFLFYRDGSLVDLTGQELRFSLKAGQWDAEPKIYLSTIISGIPTNSRIEVVNGSGGYFRVVLGGKDTAALAKGDHWFWIDTVTDGCIDTIYKDLLEIV